jgi:hypothetical protein
VVILLPAILVNRRSFFYLLWLCPATFGKQFSGKNSRNQLNKWNKSSLH